MIDMGNNINAPNTKLTLTNTFPEIVLSFILKKEQ